MFRNAISLGAGLLVGILIVVPAAAQINPDYLPQSLVNQQIIGYQRQDTLPQAPAAPQMTQPYQASGPYVSGGQSYGAGSVVSFGGQSFTIYKPGAVARVPYLAGQAIAQQTMNWPPRGGPWGVGPVTPAADGSEEQQAPATVPGLLMPGAPPELGLAPGGEPARPEMGDTTELTEETDTARATFVSPMERYRPRTLAATALYEQYLTKVNSARSGLEEGQPSTPRTPTGSASLGSVYSQRLRETTTPQNNSRIGSGESGEPAAAKQPSLMRYLSPIYHHAKGVGEDVSN